MGWGKAMKEAGVKAAIWVGFFPFNQKNTTTLSPDKGQQNPRLSG